MIKQTLPLIKKTRWSNLVDFYTLFLVLTKKVEMFPLNAEKRNVLRERLISFSDNVTEYQKTADEEATKKVTDQLIVDYASGIRNSSDLGSRRIRFNALNAVLEEIW